VGRYQTAYASASCSSLGHGEVVATPHRTHRTLPGRRLSSAPKWCPHQAQSLAGGAAVREYARAALTSLGESLRLPAVPAVTRDAGFANDKEINPLLTDCAKAGIARLTAAEPRSRR